MSQFLFVMRAGPNVGKTFELELPEVTIGRDISNQISINDAEVSRKHVRLTLKGNGYEIEDLGSTNGTFVNGQRIRGPVQLKIGDLVAFGENIAYCHNVRVRAITQMSQIVVAHAAAPCQADTYLVHGYPYFVRNWPHVQHTGPCAYPPWTRSPGPYWAPR